MTKLWTLMTTVAVLGLCQPASAETIPAAGQTITTADARFAAPADWTLERADKIVRLIAPEGDLRMTLVDVGPAKDAAAAVAAAHALAEPGFARKLRLSTPMPAREGWDEIVNFDYETSPNEKRSIVATPYRAGASWLVLLGDGGWATFNKRSGAINTFFDSIRPAKYVKESFAGRVPHKLDPARIALIREFVADGMRQLGIPGAGVAFIQDGRIVDEGGIGVRELGKPEKVDANTRFMIASNTKGMTTLLLAKLVDQGKLRWDQPVADAYPAFRLGSDDVTKAIRIRHLVCACTGMPRQDLEWIMTGDLKTPASRVFDIMKTMQPTSKFGEVYQYSNILAAAAGMSPRISPIPRWKWVPATIARCGR
ncbi:beta-lactamase family protein [Sphingomonas aliaeris]|uniref:Beta-lactamase family protein n=1 Tax=Sphingomonas aliaeris TaxID=2759526 RepID=A0A974NXC4_9SPHN|nr:serine hydrolase domain-containing protein [Sphingomonas aliaeris]QQV78621.1 beta-lactamase family protein [Sphingomonas aliaeris]